MKGSIILTIIQRTLGLPFFICMAFIGVMILFVKFVVNFILYGGEAIAYTQEKQRKTINDVFEKLNEKL